MQVVAEKLNFYYDKKSKNKVRALSDVTLTIPEGSFSESSVTPAAENPRLFNI